MYIFLILTYLLSIVVHINGSRIPSFIDEKDYNPCATKLGSYFYPHPTDVYKYYQCDETGNTYIRSCGDLVWDELRVTCNWPSAGAHRTSQVSSTRKPWVTTKWSTAAPSRSLSMLSWLTRTSTQSFPTVLRPTTTSSWFSSPSSKLATTTSSSPSTTTKSLSALFWPKTNPSRFPSTSSRSTTTSSSSSTTTTTAESSSTTDSSLLSLCKPINPCGDHGECIESSQKVPSSVRRFACICSENWFGRLCDKPIRELTTPSSPLFDQNANTYETNESFSLPVKTAKDSKLLFYGLKADNTLQAYNQMIKNINSPN